MGNNIKGAREMSKVRNLADLLLVTIYDVKTLFEDKYHPKTLPAQITLGVVCYFRELVSNIYQDYKYNKFIRETR